MHATNKNCFLRILWTCCCTAAAYVRNYPRNNLNLKWKLVTYKICRLRTSLLIAIKTPILVTEHWTPRPTLMVAENDLQKHTAYAKFNRIHLSDFSGRMCTPSWNFKIPFPSRAKFLLTFLKKYLSWGVEKTKTARHLTLLSPSISGLLFFFKKECFEHFTGLTHLNRMARRNFKYPTQKRVNRAPLPFRRIS